jgi:glycosyltransferase involved in cell wall biosynthesis
MKIALDLRRIRNLGIGRYMRCLTEAMLGLQQEHEFVLILPPDSLGMISTGPDVTTEKIPSKLKCYSVREQIELPRILRQHAVDVAHAPHFNIPLLSSCPTVATIHDLIYIACPEDLPSRAGRIYYRGMMAATVRFADQIITDSEFSKREILRLLKTDRDIEVIYPGVDRDFQPVTDAARLRDAQARYGIDADYILYTGIYKPRKNHAGLLRAFRRFLDLRGEVAMVIVGPMDEGEASLRKLARELNVADRVIFTGFVDEADLPALYSGARVYACPSLYEGFGQTVLEAMACGVPVVCSPETSLPEVAGAAALYADARNATEFGDALYQAFTDEALRRMLVNKGLANASRFSWHDAAVKTLAVYQRAVGEPVGNVVCA